MPVWIRVEGQPRVRLSGRELRACAERMLRAMRLGDRELSILLCDDRVMRELNRAYREKDRPTDVLAFAQREGEGPAIHAELLGDVVIALDTAWRRARARGRTLEDEVIELLAHGLLHLLGLDHRTRTEERRMRARTDLLCAAARDARSRRSGGGDRPRSP
jgi:probable rRNA maturation factor